MFTASKNKFGINALFAILFNINRTLFDVAARGTLRRASGAGFHSNVSPAADVQLLPPKQLIHIIQSSQV